MEAGREESGISFHFMGFRNRKNKGEMGMVFRVFFRKNGWVDDVRRLSTLGGVRVDTWWCARRHLVCASTDERWGGVL